eukprot:g9598.t1
MQEGRDVISPSNTGGGSITSDNSTNLVTVIKELKKFDGSDPAEVKTWMKEFCVVVGATRKDILPLLKNQQRPDTGDINALESYTRANEDLYAILFLLVELPAALAVQKHEDDTGISRDGQAAFQELCNNYDRVTDEVIRAKMDELENDPMNPGDNPDDYFNKKILLRAQLNKMGEPVTDRRFKDICIQGITDEYNDVKLMVFRDPSFALGEIQSTMRNIFLNSQSRKGSKGRIAGRGFAMTTRTSDLICRGCQEHGQIKRNCPNVRAKRTKPAGTTKWCSVHNTTSHSDEECYSQGATRPETKKKPDKAVAACAHCNHYSASTSNKQEPSKEKATIDFTRDEDDGFENAFMFGTCSRFNGRDFSASETGVRLLVDTGASETMFDSRLIPEGRIKDYKSRTTPKIIDVAGEGELQGIATGVLHCTVLDKKGKQPAKPSYRPPSKSSNKVSTPAASRAMCSVAVAADTWHRRLGHIHPRNMDILRKDPDTGVDYSDQPSPCVICEVGKHKDSPHPKKSTRELSRPGELVVIDNLGPVNPPAKSKGGSLPYACKITDDFTKMKEVYLLRKKSDTSEAMHAYNMRVAADGYRIETIRCDKGGENTGPNFASATPFFKMHHKSPDLSGLRAIGARAFVHHERYRKKLDDRAFEGKLCGYGLDSKTYRIFNPSNGTVVESRKVTFIETPPRSVPYQYSDEAHSYESDVLSFTSPLGPENPTTTAALDFPTQNELLRQEIRHMQQDNSDREELRLELEQDDIQDQEEASLGTASSPGGVSVDAHNSGGTGDSGSHGPGGAAESGGVSDQDESSDAAGDAATEDTSGPAAPAESSSTSGTNHLGGASATGAARLGMRRLEVTRASTRRKPTHDDPVDLDLVPGTLTVTRNDNGNARGTTRMAISPADPATLTFDQLSTIAAQSSQLCHGGVEDSVHFPEDPATGYVYATRREAPHGLLEETSQVLKIPNTYAEAMNSPQHEEWKGACTNEMKSLKKYDVYTLTPLSSVPKTDKILGTKFVFNKSWTEDSKLAWSSVDTAKKQNTTTDAAMRRDVDVRPAPGETHKDPETGEPIVYKLERSLYGLSQSPAQWNDTLDATLSAFGWKRTQSDPCVYTYTDGATMVILSVYTDSSFGENPDNGRSTTGPLFFLGGGLLNFGAKSQTIAAQSTVEAEIQAISYAAREAVYISKFMGELKFKNFKSGPIHSDSTGALTVAGNAMHSHRTKHVALLYFFIRELVTRGKISLHHRRSNQQLADIATKHLPKQRFMSMLQQIQNFSS